MCLPISILPLKPTSQHKFSENMLCCVIGNRLIGPSVIEDHTGASSCLNLLQTSLPLPLQDVPLQTRWRLVCHLMSADEKEQNTLTATLLDLSSWFHKAVPRSRKISHLFIIYYGWQKKDYWSSVEIANKRRNLTATRGVGWPHIGKWCKVPKRRQSLLSDSQNFAHWTVEVILNSNQCNKIDILWLYLITRQCTYNVTLWRVSL